MNALIPIKNARDVGPFLLGANNILHVCLHTSTPTDYFYNTKIRKNRNPNYNVLNVSVTLDC